MVVVWVSTVTLPSDTVMVVVGGGVDVVGTLHSLQTSQDWTSPSLLTPVAHQDDPSKSAHSRCCFGGDDMAGKNDLRNDKMCSATNLYMFVEDMRPISSFLRHHQSVSHTMPCPPWHGTGCRRGSSPPCTRTGRHTYHT